MNLLLIIDMQKAFMNRKTTKLVKKIEKLINDKVYDKVAFTKFVNSLDSNFVRDLNYYKCIKDDNKLAISTKENKVFIKKTYSAFNDDLKKYLTENNINKIYLCGLETDACVLKTALDLFENEYDFYVLKDFCGCTNGKRAHLNAIKILQKNIGKKRVI